MIDINISSLLYAIALLQHVRVHHFCVIIYFQEGFLSQYQGNSSRRWVGKPALYYIISTAMTVSEMWQCASSVQKGQNLEPFLQSFFISCEQPRPKPSRPELTVLSPTAGSNKKVLQIIQVSMQDQSDCSSGGTWGNNHLRLKDRRQLITSHFNYKVAQVALPQNHKANNIFFTMWKHHETDTTGTNLFCTNYKLINSICLFIEQCKVHFHSWKMKYIANG